MSPLLVSIHTSTYNHTTGGWRLICRPRELCHVAWRNVIAVDRSDNRGHRSYICIVLTCTRIRVRSFDNWTCILYYQDDDDDDMAKARLQVARTEIRVSVPPRMRHGGIPHGTAHRRDMRSQALKADALYFRLAEVRMASERRSSSRAAALRARNSGAPSSPAAGIGKSSRKTRLRFWTRGITSRRTTEQSYTCRPRESGRERRKSWINSARTRASPRTSTPCD